MQAEPARFPVLGVQGGEGAPLVPLQLMREICALPENVSRNLAATLATAYEPVNALLDSQEGEVSVVGSGPSLAKTYRSLRGDVWACNAAYGWLLERGITAKWCMLWDADPVVAKFAVPHPGTIYLVASRCHQSVFDALKGCHVVVWHAQGDADIQALLEKAGRLEPMLGGGSAAVTRAMMLAFMFGYRKIHLHGADSSYEEGYTHVRKSVVPEKELMVMVNEEDGRMKWYKTTAWLAAQAEDFKLLGPYLTQLGGKVIVHGDGLLPYVAKQLGFDVDGQSKIYQFARSLRQGARELARQL